MNKKIIISTITLAALTVMPLLASAQTISSISPTSVSSGSGDTAITITGTGFTSGAVVNLNGSAVTTTYVSPTQLKATIPASSLANSGDATITVTNPGGGAASNSMTLRVGTGASNTSDTTTAGLPNTGFGPNNTGMDLNVTALMMAIAAASLVLILAIQAKRAYLS